VRQVIHFPAFLPDQLPRNVLTVAENVYPASSGAQQYGAMPTTSYRSVPSYVSITTALPAKFQGGASVMAQDGTAYLLAGTAAGLSKLAAGAWTSLLTGLTITGRWRFAQFGNHVVTVNGGVTQVVDLAASTAGALSGAPTGTGIAVIGDFVVITQAGGNNAMVQWSAFGDYTGWTAAVNQSGFQPMLTGGEIKGIAGGEYGIILQRFRLVRMERSGDATAPFNFPEITTNFGCASAGSIAQAGRTIFFLSDRGFIAIDDGSTIRPIGNEKFDQSFKDSVSPDEYDQIWSAVDPKRSLVFWGKAGSPGRVWVYNWVLDKASTISLSHGGFFAGYTSSLTLEQVSALYTNIDTMGYSLDDPRFQGGDPRLYFVGPDNSIGALSGPNLAATLTLGQTEVAGEQVSRVRGVWPISDATSGVTVNIDARQRLGDAQSVSVSGAIQPSGRVPVRCKGRFLGVSTAIAAGTPWSYIQGVELEVEGAGLRG
jgi:hypothetical protein